MDKRKRMMICWLFLQAIGSSVFSAEWKAHVVKELTALETSCVVVPCSFTYSEGMLTLPTSGLRGIWHSTNQSQVIYHEDDTNIMDNFKGRTNIVGRLGDGNCTLEMVEVKEHDSVPFCFRVEISENNQFSFMENCVRLKILPHPPKPQLIQPKTAIQGHPYILTCYVTHTCPSHMPKLTWSKSSTYEIIENSKDNGFGNWETKSILMFIPEEGDDHSEITCTSEFYGGSSSSVTLQLFVKREKTYLHIILPTVVGLGTAVIFGAVCAVMMKKYRSQIAALQSSREGSVWNRISRLSRRIHSGGRGAFYPQQRRPQRDMVDSGADHTPNSATTSANQNIYKPHFPSPKSQPRSSVAKSVTAYNEDSDSEPDYTNTEDLNIYGNI